MAKNLSKFVFKQLVYDYLIGDLVDDELTKFESKLQAESDCHDYVELTKKSMNYVNELSHLTINDEIEEGVKGYNKNNLFYIYNPFSFKIPKVIKVGVPLFTLAGAIYLASIILPTRDAAKWIKKQIQTSTVHEVAPLPDLGGDVDSKAAINVKDVKIDPKIPEPIKTFTNNNLNEAKSVKLINGAEKKKGSVVANNDIEYVTKLNKISSFKPYQLNKVKYVVVKEVIKVKEPVKKKSGPQGVLYRAYMSIRNLDTMRPQIVEIIERMNGEKAGKKELGYLKPKGRSFHYKLPKEARDQVFKELRAFGRVKVDKEEHWRVMPEGQSRIILWVEDLDLKAERMKSR